MADKKIKPIPDSGLRVKRRITKNEIKMTLGQVKDKIDKNEAMKWQKRNTSR